jgi:hypothetical protein
MGNGWERYLFLYIHRSLEIVGNVWMVGTRNGEEDLEVGGLLGFAAPDRFGDTLGGFAAHNRVMVRARMKV